MGLEAKLRVKDICKERGLTLKQLAERIGIAPETLTRSISENANPTLATLRQIANALDLQVVDLFDRTDATHQVFGHIEVDGEVYSIRSIGDLGRLYEGIK